MRTVEMSDETYQALESHFVPQPATADVLDSYDDMIGRCWFIRSVTYHYVGRVVAIFGESPDTTLVLAEASWVADSGRFMQCIATGSLQEVEPVGTMYVKVSGIIDFFPWRHKLPTEQK